MSTVIVAVETQAQQFPSTTVSAGVSISLSGGAVPAQVISAAPYSATFADVAPGTYTASAVATDSAGNPLGTPIVSVEFTVAAPVSIDVPSVINVTVS